MYSVVCFSLKVILDFVRKKLVHNIVYNDKLVIFGVNYREGKFGGENEFWFNGFDFFFLFIYGALNNEVLFVLSKFL
jgi:hypothetical protein